MNLNKVYLIGRLTQDPETKITPSGDMVCTFGLATNRVWNDKETKQRQEKTEFHNIVLWRRLAEIASHYLNKGSLVLIEGRIQTRSWQDQQSGIKRYRTEIVAENIQIGPKSAVFQSVENEKNQNNLNDKSKGEIPEGEIPVMEEEQITAIETASEDNEEEIDIKDIPF